MTIGIYKLNFIGTDKVYIGQSNNMEYRYKGHLRSFIDKSASIKMQEAYSLYSNPTYSILIECVEEDLDINENEAIDIFDSVTNGFNSLSSSCKFISNQYGSNNARAIHSNETIIKVFNILIDNPDMLYKDIETLTGVSYGTINMIAHGGNHKWLAKEYPDKYSALLDRVGKRKNTCRSAKAQKISYPEIISPEKIIYTISNAREFAREHNLDQSALLRLLKGIAKTHKGWKLK